AAVVERHRVYYAGVGRQLQQPPRIVGGRRQRLVGDDVLAGANRRGDDGHVQMIRRRVVDDVDVRIGHEVFVAAVRLWDAECVRLGARRRLAAGDHRDNVDESETADRVDVMGTDEAGADEAHTDTRPG